MQNILLALTILAAIPRLTHACISNSSTETYEISIIFLASLFFVLLLIITKSIKNKKLYKGRLYIPLGILLILFIIAFTNGGYQQYNEIKARSEKIKDCEKNCTPEQRCFCNPMCF